MEVAAASAGHLARAVVSALPLLRPLASGTLVLPLIRRSMGCASTGRTEAWKLRSCLGGPHSGREVFLYWHKE